MATSTLLRPPEVPPFQLQPALDNLFPDRTAVTDTHPSSGPFDTPQNTSHKGKERAPALRTADAADSLLWLGASDGSVSAYDVARDIDDNHVPVASVPMSASFRPVDKLVALPQLDVLLVLCEGVLTFYSPKSLSPLANPPPIKNVVTFAVDVNTNLLSPPCVCVAVIKQGGVILCGLTLDGIISLYEFELQDHQGPIYFAVLRGQALCAANIDDYFIIDFAANSTIPLVAISQLPPDSSPNSQAPPINRPDPNRKPAIAPIGTDEFLIASHTGNSTLGICVRITGDPSRGTIEWASNVRSIAIDPPYILALLRNATIEVHSLTSQEIVQVVQLPTSFEPRSLSTCTTTALKAISSTEDPRLQLIPLSPKSPSPLQDSDVSMNASHDSDKLPHTPTPVRTWDISSNSIASPTSSNSTPPASDLFSNASSQTLVLGKSSLQALCKVSLIAQADALMRKRRFGDSVILAAQAENGSELPLTEVFYIYQSAALRNLFETKFEEAGSLFLRGSIDPRFLIRLFPEFLEDDFDSSQDENMIKVFQGLEPGFSKAQSINRIISNSLERNYSPHVKPDIESSPATKDLSTYLYEKACKMLKTFLQDWRDKHVNKKPLSEEMLPMVISVDTTLAKILSEDDDTNVLMDFITNSPSKHYSSEELFRYLSKNERIWHLAEMYIHLSRIPEALEIWTRALENDERNASNHQVAIESITEQVCKLNGRKDIVHYGLWILQRNRAEGIKALGQLEYEDESSAKVVLDRVREIDPDVAIMIMESYVFRTADNSGKLSYFHDELVSTYLRQLRNDMADDDMFRYTSDQVDQFISQNTRSSESSSSFLDFYLNSILGSDLEPDLELTRTRIIDYTRLKLIYLLENSVSYDAMKAKLTLDSLSTLCYERAIVLSKLSMQRKVLQLLVKDLCDFVSAEVYCSTLGTLIPSHTRQILISKLNSMSPTITFEPMASVTSNENEETKNIKSSTRRKQGHAKKSMMDKARKEWFGWLVDICLETFTKVPQSSVEAEKEAWKRKETSRIINTQAINLETLDILSRIPDNWPLQQLTTFLERSTRRDYNARNEARILKSIALCENLRISLDALEKMEKIGPKVIKKEGNDSDDGGSSSVGKKEKREKGVTSSGKMDVVDLEAAEMELERAKREEKTVHSSLSS